MPILRYDVFIGFTLVDGGSIEWKWKDGREYCVDNMGSDYYSINAEEKQSNVESTAIANGVSQKCWGGLSDDLGTGDWLWVDGEERMNYSNWKGGARPDPSDSLIKIILRIDKDSGNSQFGKWDASSSVRNGVNCVLCTSASSNSNVTEEECLDVVTQLNETVTRQGEVITQLDKTVTLQSEEISLQSEMITQLNETVTRQNEKVMDIFEQIMNEIESLRDDMELCSFALFYPFLPPFYIYLSLPRSLRAPNSVSNALSNSHLTIRVLHGTIRRPRMQRRYIGDK